MMIRRISALRTYGCGYKGRAMSSTNVSIRDEKKALRKSIKEELATIPLEDVMDQCAKTP
jgi:hypothetical protein